MGVKAPFIGNPVTAALVIFSHCHIPVLHELFSNFFDGSVMWSFQVNLEWNFSLSPWSLSLGQGHEAFRLLDTRVAVDVLASSLLWLVKVVFLAIKSAIKVYLF